MKRILVLAIVAVAVLSVSVQAKEAPVTTDKIEKIIKLYKESLKVDNEGVRQSTLYQLARIKVDYPWADLSGIAKDVERVSQKDASATVRIQANLTLAYLTEEGLSQKVQPLVPDEYAGFYNKVQSELFGAAEQVAE